VIVADQNRVGEAKASNAIGDLPNLFTRMRASVAAIRLQPGDRDHFQCGRVLLHLQCSSAGSATMVTLLENRLRTFLQKASAEFGENPRLARLLNATVQNPFKTRLKPVLEKTPM
jgi:hypothetical protein